MRTLPGDPRADLAPQPSGSPSRPLAEASKRLRRPAGRPRRVRPEVNGGLAVQGAVLAPAAGAGKRGDFAHALPPRGLPLPAAAIYSGIPMRRLWDYIRDGRLAPIRLPGMRRVLLDRYDVDRLLEAGKEPR